MRCDQERSHSPSCAVTEFALQQTQPYSQVLLFLFVLVIRQLDDNDKYSRAESDEATIAPVKLRLTRKLSSTKTQSRLLVFEFINRHQPGSILRPRPGFSKQRIENG